MENERFEIVYLWINKTKYNCFSGNEFNFSPYYSLTFDSISNTLIATRTEYINVFDCKQSITNITAIVGNNGVGKTTLLNYVLNLERSFNSKRRNEENSFIICYCVNDHLYVENFTDSSIEFKDTDNSLRHINVFNSSHKRSIIASLSIAYVSVEPRTKGSLDYSKRSSFIAVTPKQINDSKARFFDDKLFQIDDVGTFLVDRNKFDFESFINVSYLANHRIFEISDKTVSVSFLKFEDIFKKNPATTYKYLGDLQEVNVTSLDSFYTFYGPTLGLLNNFLKEVHEIEGIKLFDDGLFPGTRDSEYWIERIEYLIKGMSHQGESKQYFINAIKEIKIAHNIFGKNFNPDKANELKDVLKSKYKEEIPAQKLRRLINNIINSRKSFIFKYLVFDINKSDGELSYLNHLSYLYYLSQIDRFTNLDVLKESLVIMMDEIDVHMHPEWQRQLLNKLVQSINEMFGGKNIQIILSTHSPLVLSDFPPQNIIYISRKKDGVRQIERRMDRETFGANIYTLYNDSFYFDGGVLIGEFAKRYIDDLYEIVSSRNYESKEHILKKISIVGEPLLRKQLLDAADIFAEKKQFDNRDAKVQVLHELKQKMQDISVVIDTLERYSK